MKKVEKVEIAPDREALVNEETHSLYVSTIIAIVINFSLTLIILVTFFIILNALCTKIYRRLEKVSKKTRTCHKLIKEKLSPTPEEFLAVCSNVNISTDQVTQLYADYDMQRRKAAMKFLHFETIDDVPKIKLFEKFINESQFMKSLGFRMHRLLHQMKHGSSNYPDQRGNVTKLPPAFTD